MNIAVVAANGRTGRAFVRTALKAGHSIRAGVHTTHTLKPHPNLTIVHCDATNEADITELLRGCQAVASFIGHEVKSPAHVQRDSMQTVTTVMQALNIRRIVSLTGTGVRLPGDKIPLIDRIVNFFVEKIDPARVQDGRDHLEVLTQSSLDWTVLRVLRLTTGPLQPYMLREHGPTKWSTSRREVAAAALHIVQSDAFLQQAPIISRA